MAPLFGGLKLFKDKQGKTLEDSKINLPLYLGAKRTAATAAMETCWIGMDDLETRRLTWTL